MHKLFQKFTGNLVISRDLILLLIIGGLYALGIFLSNTFVNVYLWKQAGDYMTIAIYNLGVFIFQPLTFIVAGKIAKKVDRIIVLRLGVTFLSLFFLCVLLIAENASTYNFMLGSLLGIGYGFYWLAFDVLTFEITEPDTRDFFNGVLGVLQSLGGMIGPLLAGSIIARLMENTGYKVIFTISFILFVCAIGLSFFLYRRQAEGSFEMKRVIKERKHNRNWKWILNAHIFQGMREGIFLFVITIWVFVTTGSEFSLGIFNLVLSGLSFVFYFIATRFIKPYMRKNAILAGGLLLFLALFVILFHINYPLLLIYAVLVGAAYPIISVPYVSLTYDVIGTAKYAKELRIEYIVVRELFMNIGRVVSIGTFILTVSMFPSETAIPVLLVLFGTGHVIIYGFVKNIQLEQNTSRHTMIQDQVTNEKKQ